MPHRRFRGDWWCAAGGALRPAVSGMAVVAKLHHVLGHDLHLRQRGGHEFFSDRSG